MDDAPEIFNTKAIKAYPRQGKSYCCYECRALIERGETHYLHKGLWDGQFSQYRICVSCNDYLEQIWTSLWEDKSLSWFDAPVYGDLLDWCREFGFEKGYYQELEEDA